MNRITASFGVAAIVLAGCAAPDGGDPYDPFEPVNRAVHEGNKALDTFVLSPAADGYGALAPQPVRTSVSNFAANLSVPSTVVNDLLQLNIEDAAHNTMRFLVNSTLGLAGLLDPATEFGLEERKSDFGETLFVWGFAEGPYLELPGFGPSTVRDAVGLAVDFAINPVNDWLPVDQQWVPGGAYMLSRLNDRFTFGGTVDSVLYESADSYAQTRLFYLESRRFDLGDEVSGEDDLYDFYEDALE